MVFMILCSAGREFANSNAERESGFTPIGYNNWQCAFAQDFASSKKKE